jgi:multiple sugar transport system ATP-binding protein
VYSVRFEGVRKRYPGSDRDALHDLCLTIEAEELLSIVGPSGCGKSTALRILAGLERPTLGTVHLGGLDITNLETRRRHVGLITQENQLANHMTARRNIQFPLEVRPSPGPLGRALPEDRREPGKLQARVAAEAAKFGITELLDRRPRTLSEGQRRLVQLVRAVVASPSTLLMDEPLGYLEDQVRAQLRSEILRVHRERRLTSVMVTASQHDAMVMSDRIAVMIDGTVQQVGTPTEVYERPTTADVASVLGEPSMNLLPAIVRVDGGERRLELSGRTIRMWSPLLDRLHDLPIVVGVRPEDVELGVPQDEGLAAEVVTTELVGHTTSVLMRTVAGEQVACTVTGVPPRIGTVVDVGFRSDRVHLFDAVTGAALHHPVG